MTIKPTLALKDKCPNCGKSFFFWGMFRPSSLMPKLNFGSSYAPISKIKCIKCKTVFDFHVHQFFKNCLKYYVLLVLYFAAIMFLPLFASDNIVRLGIIVWCISIMYTVWKCQKIPCLSIADKTP